MSFFTKWQTVEKRNARLRSAGRRHTHTSSSPNAVCQLKRLRGHEQLSMANDSFIHQFVGG